MAEHTASGYKTVSIQNRRYLGNKYKLLPFITRVVREQGLEVGSFADLFAGTGAVSSAFQDKRLITNDLLYSNYICNCAWFGPESFRQERIVSLVESYNAAGDCDSNYMTEHFADTYFSREDCSKIGFIREDIERQFLEGRLNRRERAILITSLLYAMDRIAKTCGHYDAYRRGAVFDGRLELAVPAVFSHNHPENQCFHQDANRLAGTIQADLVYLDPPYKSRQYSGAYHLLENVALWEKPRVFGVARKMDRTALKSRYCTREAGAAFAELIRDVRAKYILLSYNNMAEKGNVRSNAKLSDEEILCILREKGDVQVFSEEYRAFTAGKSEISGHQERLFLCECHGENAGTPKRVPK